MPPGFPEAPKHLSPGELELWQTFPRVPWIVSSDAMAVNAAVSVFDRILQNQRAQAQPSAEGVKSLVAQEVKLWTRLMSILAALGLTPADRAKMTVRPPNEQPKNKWAGVL